MDLKCSTQPGVLNTSAWVGGSTLRLAKPLQSEPMAKIGHWRLTFERRTQPLAPVFLSAPGQLWYEPFLTLFLRKPLSRFPHHDSLKPSTTGNQKKNSSLKWLYWVFDRSIKNPFKGIPQWPNFFQLVPFFKGSPNGIAGWWASLRCMNLWRTLTQIITSSMCHGRIND